jgi:hypothetical protein
MFYVLRKEIKMLFLKSETVPEKKKLITRLTPGVLLPPDNRHELKFLIPITPRHDHYHGD